MPGEHSGIKTKGVKALFVSSLICFFLFTEGTGNELSGQSLSFRHYGVAEGLPQSVILKIFQDEEGFLWLGTQNGLGRFDGYSFLNFFNNPLDSNSVNNNWIYDIAADHEGRIYLATKSGLNVYDKSGQRFSVLDIPGGEGLNPGNFIYGLAIRDSLLYINIPPVLVIYNTLTRQFSQFQSRGPAEQTVYDIGLRVVAAKTGLVWLASHQGLRCFDNANKSFLEVPEVKGFDRNTYVSCLFEDQDGGLLAGTDSGLFLVNQQDLSVRRLKAIEDRMGNQYIRAITRDTKGRLWIATEGNGVHMIRHNSDWEPIESEAYRGSQGFISHDIVYSLYIDHSDNLWTGTISGLDVVNLKPSGIRYYSTDNGPDSYNLLDNIIASVYTDEDERLWIGNWGKGLNILNKPRDRKNILHYASSLRPPGNIPENHVHLIFRDSRQRVWIGTRNGMAIYGGEQQGFIPIHEYFNAPAFNCFRNLRLYCILETADGKIWIGSGNGITILDTENKTIESFHTGAPGNHRINSNLVYSILEDDENLIWIATPEGLNVFDPQKQIMRSIRKIPGKLNSLCNDYTISLIQDHLGYIWIGTGSGLNRYSKKDSTFLYYSRANGLPSEIIYDIMADNRNRLWFTTGRGVVWMVPVSEGTSSFNQIEELKDKEFNLKAVHRSAGGELFFGSIHGLYSFYPDSLKRNLYIPPVRFTGAEKENSGQKTSLNTSTGKLQLSYRDYNLTIGFAALDFTSPGKNRYQYRLEGVSRNWTDLGNQNFVHFTSLPPGNYTLLVKGSNNDGIWNEEALRLEISISPPWYASQPALVGYLLMLFAAVWLTIKIRERTLRKDKRLLEEEVARRTIEIARQKELAEEMGQKLSSTINSLDDIVFVLDEGGYLREFYNPAHRPTHFIFPERHLGMHFKEIGFPDEIAAQFQKAFETFPSGNEIIEFDHQLKEKEFTLWFNTKISPKRNNEGKLTGVVVMAREITDRKAAEDLLKKQKEELDSLNTTKDKFFSILAHDLKNPFANLNSLSELLVDHFESLDEQEKKESLTRIRNNSAFIYELLENLLTWSGSQRGKLDFEPVRFSLLTSVEININLLALQSANKGITIHNLIKEDYQVYGDRNMINTVLRNLLSNAVKFTPNGGNIRIEAFPGDGTVNILIRDEGVGIPAENVGKLFRLDHKYKTPGTAGETGTGLGLVLCREFVAKNGGDIWYEPGEVRGSVFGIRLKQG